MTVKSMSRHAAIAITLLAFFGCVRNSDKQLFVVGESTVVLPYVPPGTEFPVTFTIRNSRNATEVVSVRKSCQCVNVELAQRFPTGDCSVCIKVKGTDRVSGYRSAFAVIDFANGEQISLCVQYGAGGRLTARQCVSEKSGHIGAIVEFFGNDQLAHLSVIDSEIEVLSAEFFATQKLSQQRVLIPFSGSVGSASGNDVHYMQVVVTLNDGKKFSTELAVRNPRTPLLSISPTKVVLTSERRNAVIFLTCTEGGTLTLSPSAFIVRSNLRRMSKRSWRCDVEFDMEKLDDPIDHDRFLIFQLSDAEGEVANNVVRLERH